MNAPSPSQPPPNRIPRGAVPSFGEEDPNRQRRFRPRGAVSPLRLGPTERSELEYLWHAYESDLGCRSLHASVGARLLRSPPNDAVQGLVVAELERSGRLTRQKLVDLVVLEGLATHYELRRAIDALVGKGRVVVDEGVLRLAVPARSGRSRSERWAAEDADLEAYCQTIAVKDHELPSHADVEPWTSRGARLTLAALAAIRPLQALVLRRFYGERDPSARYDAFGELAPLVEFTARVRTERARRIEAAVDVMLERAIAEAGKTQRDWELELAAKQRVLDRARRENLRWRTAKTLADLGKAAQGRHNVECVKPNVFDSVETERLIRRGVESVVTVASVLRELLDTPKRDGRSALVKQVSEQAERILIDACCAYRAARRTGR